MTNQDLVFRAGDERPIRFWFAQVLINRIKQTFEPPRVRSRALSELQKFKQGKRDVHAYAQHVGLFASSIITNSVHEHTLMTVFMQGIGDGPVRNHLFRFELNTLEEEISDAKQEDCDMRTLMLDRALVFQQDGKILGVQNQYTIVMLIARDLVLQTTSHCRSAIAVRS